MTKIVHQVTQYPTHIAGMDAMSLMTEHSFPRHAHDQFGIGIITNGAQRSWSGVGHVEAQAGDIITVNPGEIHDGVPTGGARGWHMIYLAPQQLTDVLTGEFSHPAELVLRPVVKDSYLNETMMMLFTEIKRNHPDTTAIEETCLLTLMRLTRFHLLTEKRSLKNSPDVQLAKQCLDDTPASTHSLEHLAGLCGISKFQLIRSFSRDMGITPHAYLTQLRVRLARQLLTEGKRPAEVADIVGFADQSHLTRAFVRHFAVTPGRFQAMTGYE